MLPHNLLIYHPRKTLKMSSNRHMRLDHDQGKTSIFTLKLIINIPTFIYIFIQENVIDIVCVCVVCFKEVKATRISVYFATKFIKGKKYYTGI